MLSLIYYIISPQQAYNILLDLYCLNCSTFDVPQVPVCAKKTKLKIKNLLCTSHLIKLVLYNLYTTNQGTVKSRP